MLGKHPNCQIRIGGFNSDFKNLLGIGSQLWKRLDLKLAFIHKDFGTRWETTFGFDLDQN